MSLMETKVEPQIEIEGEAFRVEQEDGLIYLTHPRWSLTGTGETLLDAEMDMRYTAHVVFPVYHETDREDMTPSAWEMYQYMLKVKVDPVDEEGDCRCYKCNCQ